MNICVMASSELPRDRLACNSFSMAEHVLHPTFLHPVSTWLQLHMHMNLPPTCFARSESCCAPAGVISSGTTANIASIIIAATGRFLVMAISQGNRRGESVCQWLCCRLRGPREHQHSTAVRQHCHQRSKHHHRSSKPDPLHQGI